MNRVGEREALFASLFLSAWKKRILGIYLLFFLFQKRENTVRIFFIFSLLAVENEIKGDMDFLRVVVLFERKLQKNHLA